MYTNKHVQICVYIYLYMCIYIYLYIPLLVSQFGVCKLYPSGNSSRTFAPLGGGSNDVTPTMCETHLLFFFVAFRKAHSPCGGNFKNHSEGRGGF